MREPSDMHAVEIVSASPTMILRFSDFDGKHYVASFDSPAIGATVKVYAFNEAGIDDIGALIDLFKFMVENWKGWDDVLSWESLEGEFAIEAASDSLGHVTLHLKFQEIYEPAPWSAEIEITLETMQVEKALQDLQIFFS